MGLIWYYMRMLRISKLTDYAILAMVELTRDGEMLSAHALSERVGVELPTASKVLKMLAGYGLLDSYRGANGGYRAGRPASDISVAEVIAAIAGYLRDATCVGRGKRRLLSAFRSSPNGVFPSERSASTGE